MLIAISVFNLGLLAYVIWLDVKQGFEHDHFGKANLPKEVEFIFQMMTLLSLLGYFIIGGLSSIWFSDRTEVRLK